MLPTTGEKMFGSSDAGSLHVQFRSLINSFNFVSSPQGHILVLAGFGNLRGQMEVWDVKKYKQVRNNRS